MPGLLLGDEAPNFQADTTHGPIRFHEFLGDSWGILFSHPRDFTPVCTTELGRAAKLAPEFAKRKVKLIALSIDDVSDHLAWCKDINAYNSDKPIDKLPFPIIADLKRELSVQLGMLDPDEIGKDGMPLTARVVFIFGPDKKLKLSILYPATTGRNFDEILRVVDSLQLTAVKKVATPVDWKPENPTTAVSVVTEVNDDYSHDTNKMLYKLVTNTSKMMKYMKRVTHHHKKEIKYRKLNKKRRNDEYDEDEQLFPVCLHNHSSSADSI